MARELRSRKVSTETKNGATKTKVEKTAVKGKRKDAPEEGDSPIPRKLQKGTKKAIAKETDEPVVKVTKTTKTKTPAPKEPEVEEPELLAESDSEEEDQEEEEQTQKLAAELDPEEEEDGPDDAVVYKTGQAVGKIPDVSDAVEKAAKANTDEGNAGVIYIGRIPHGFYEHEMRQYLSQFGPINKLRLSRNKKTGASKHFAFVEFAEATTAEIVAKTMNNYLLFGHILKCRTIPKEQVREDLFKGANKRFKKVPWNKMAGLQLEKPRSESQWEKKVALEQSKRAKKAAKLKEMGYDFEPPTIRDVPPPGAVIEEPVEEVRAIEDTSAQANGDDDEPQVEVTEEVVTKKPGKKEVEVEVQSISAPKTKTKTKVAKSKKVKA